MTIEVATRNGVSTAVEGLSFELKRGEVLGIVGESGSGKSITMLALMGLLSADSAALTAGRIRLEGVDLYSEGITRYRRAVRGGALAMIFQEPMTSLNPVLTIGAQIGSAIRQHQPQLSAGEVSARVAGLLALVGVPDPERRCRQYPHEYSGGMRQRAMIAMAMANEPKVLIADEPTTALDVTVQAQIMEVLAEARARTGASMLLVTHDLGLIAENADRVLVMYGGRVVEQGSVTEIFETPRHPYTIGLLRSLPAIDREQTSLYAIPGQPPALTERPQGCVFHPRCEMSQGRSPCSQERPPMRAFSSDHASACHYAQEARRWADDLASRLAETAS
ncbi:MAG: ABC transporter ATP-binding protein [Methylobacteriaceae bacterium]|nr:ABC transporter ATP-binding protein [Methylobacteriaceae bacterium]